MKMTRSERSWVLYDVGNSAFTLLTATIIPIYFNYLSSSAGVSESDYLAYWGYGASIATLIVALMGPILGTLADTKGFKKILFTVSLLVGVAGCIGLGFTKQWLIFMVIFLIAKIGFSSSLIFYDSMLADVTDTTLTTKLWEMQLWSLRHIICLISLTPHCRQQLTKL